jgi:hypothetical protein
MMMADRITLDQISLQSNYDLTKLHDNDPFDDEINDSPFDINYNTCDYYESTDVGSLLAQENNSISLFCLNSQGLRAHWVDYI